MVEGEHGQRGGVWRRKRWQKDLEFDVTMNVRSVKMKRSEKREGDAKC